MSGKPQQLPRLALFSGLGIRHQLYARQRGLDPVRIELVPWLDVEPGESIPSYARRLAATIDPGGPLYLGGVSFGAMLAIEAASVLRPRAVFNIAGARSGRAVAPVVKLTCAVAPRLSDSTIRATLGGAGLLLRMTGRPDRRERKLLLNLADTAIPWLIRWSCGAMLDWQAPRDLDCPIHHIHGDLDHLIPLANVRKDVDEIVPGGGHIINVTHAAVVNRFILERLRR